MNGFGKAFLLLRPGHFCRRASAGLWWHLSALMVLVCAGVVLPAALKSILMVMMIYSIFAMAYDVLLGYANQPSLGQSLFFGLGGYAVILPILHLEWSIWGCLVLALVLGALSAFLVGLLAVRLTEAYHVVFTAIVASVIYLMAKNMTPITGGTGGLSVSLPPLRLGPVSLDLYSSTNNYLFILAFAFLIYLLLARLVHSPLGKVWVAVRENESRLPYLQYNTYYYKLAVFTLAGMLTSLAGALYAIRLRYASAEFFEFEWSLLPFLWIVLGGQGTLIGPVVGVVLFTLFQYYVSAWWTHYLIVFGVLILLVLRWVPRGIVGYVLALKRAQKVGR